MPGGDLGPVVRHHHGMAGGGNDAGVEADIAQFRRAPLGGRLAALGIGGIGGDALDAQQLKKARKRGVLRLVQGRQHLV